MSRDTVLRSFVAVANFIGWILLLPLFGAAVNGLFGRALGRRLTGGIGCGAPLAAFFLAQVEFFRRHSPGPIASPVETVTLAPWLSLPGPISFPLELTWDPLSAVMVLLVLGVGSLIHLYSLGYMAGDPGWRRYFVLLNLFTFFMLLLVLSENLVLLLVGWEGVGLCSYLLIGFWFEEPAKAAAGKKAFIVNRVGDFGFLLGLVLLLEHFGTLDIQKMLNPYAIAQVSPKVLACGAALLFVGATGKSAQIPLYVWLPDAMAGPTPVSALIHAATMVTAGIYLVCRLGALFLAAPMVLLVIAIVGVFTAVYAAAKALVENDIKKILAYSTISQLGTMFFAVGAGAFALGIFHLLTHGLFKALLFLSAGVIIHAVGGEQDISRMGALAKKLPVTFVAMAIGAAALSGIPPFSGFWSKEPILAHAFGKFHAGGGTSWLFLWIAAAAGAVLTAFYSGRLLARVFLGKPAEGAAMTAPSHRSAHGREGPASMMSVVVVLAIASVVGGGIPGLLALEPALDHFLTEGFGVPAHDPLSIPPWAKAAPAAVAIAALGLGAWLYARRPGSAMRFAQAGRIRTALYRLASTRYLDELYGRTIVRPLDAFAKFLWVAVDSIAIDGALAVGALAVEHTGRRIRKLQSGLVGHYVLMILAGLIGILVYWVIRVGSFF